MSFNIPFEELQILISSAASGDDSAFARLLEHYAPLINAEVSGFKNCGFDEDDVRQEAYIAFFRAVKSYTGTDRSVSFGLYAKICIKNRLISAVRKFSRYRDGEVPDALEPRTDDPVCDPYELLAGKENAALLKATVDRLLSVYEKTVLHYYIAGFSPSEIALRIGKDERSVSNALFRIRGKLKCLLLDK
ncbi:MAG: sigma-70 family RNA polymerase sigma factor [Ruminococcaceae bacterium]|nr:sigma-70 family RNA polymerase sigma factor [Oscillospiraceae bacterium]